MRTRPNIFWYRSLSLILVLAMELTQVACLKRVTVSPVESEQIRSHRNTIYVYMKSDGAHASVMAMKNPKFQAGYMVGEVEGREVKIAVESIAYIEAVRIDGKKVAVTSAVLIALLAIGYLYVLKLRLVAQD